MEEYERVSQRSPSYTTIAPNEVRVTSQGVVGNYVSYGLTLLKEKNRKTIVIKGMGGAINKAVLVAELIKQEMPKLHQLTEIGSTMTTQEYLPLVEGLTKKEVSQSLSYMHIQLSKKELDTTLPGYQAPGTSEPLKFANGGKDRKEVFHKRGRGGKNNFGGRGGRGGKNRGGNRDGGDSGGGGGGGGQKGKNGTEKDGEFFNPRGKKEKNVKGEKGAEGGEGSEGDKFPPRQGKGRGGKGGRGRGRGKGGRRGGHGHSVERNDSKEKSAGGKTKKTKNEKGGSGGGGGGGSEKGE